ncbi:pimeloyl-ACP methyl ester carboxylesterase [Mycetocola sp. CAN_C7]
MSSRYFRRLAQALSAVGTVLAIDLPGFGRAPRPSGALSIEDGADLIAAYLQARGCEETVLVGHSMGSQFVAETAARHPRLVDGIALVGPVVDERASAPWQQGMRLLRDSLRESPTANWIVMTDYVRSGIRWYLTELPVMLGYRIEERILVVDVPVVVIRGARDPIAPHGWGARLATLSHDGRLVTVPGAAHVVQHTAVGTVTQILSDLAASAVTAGATGPGPLPTEPRRRE